MHFAHMYASGTVSSTACSKSMPFLIMSSPTPRVEISIAGATQPLTVAQCGNIQGQENANLHWNLQKNGRVWRCDLSKYARMLFQLPRWA